jgi:hypothetical protein
VLVDGPQFHRILRVSRLHRLPGGRAGF